MRQLKKAGMTEREKYWHHPHVFLHSDLRGKKHSVFMKADLQQHDTTFAVQYGKG